MRIKKGYYSPIFENTKDYIAGEYLICKNSNGTKLVKGQQYKIVQVKLYIGLMLKTLVYVGIENGKQLGITWYLSDRFEPKSAKFKVDQSIRQDFQWLKELDEKRKEISERITENFQYRATLQ